MNPTTGGLAALARTYEAIERSLSSAEVKRHVGEVQGALPDLAKNLSVGQFVLDRNRNRIVARVQVDVANIGRIDGVSVSFLGKEGALSLHCYDREADFAGSLPTFDRMLDSFQYDPGFAYQPQASAIDWNKLVRGGWGGAVGGAIVGALVGIAVAMVCLLKGMFAGNKTR